MMFKAFKRTVAIAGLAIALPCFADPSVAMIAREWAAETSTIITRLPESVPSTMTATQCLNCNGLTLNVTRDTKFFLNQTAVTLDELRIAGRENHPMGVFYEPASKNVTRIVILGAKTSSEQTGR